MVGTFGFTDVPTTIFAKTATHAEEVEHRLRWPARLAFTGYHRPPAALRTCKQDVLSPQLRLLVLGKRPAVQLVRRMGQEPDCLSQLN